MGRDKTIKVCHFASGDLWAGAEAQVHTMVLSLHKLPEIEVSAILLNQGELATRLSDASIETLVIDESTNSFNQLFQKLKEYFDNNQVDLLHTHRFKENILGGKLKKAGSIDSLVQTVHGASEPFRGLAQIRSLMTGILNKRATRKYFDKVIAISCDMERQLADLYGNELVRQINNGINISNVRPTRPSNEMRAEFGIAENELLIGTAGRLVPVKGYDILINAIKKLIDSNLSVRLMICGIGPLEEELKALAGKLGISDKIIFPGFRTDVYNLINAFDLFVMSSHHEGIPVVLLEAMALGKPALVTSVGGMKEVIEENESGIFCPPADPDMMAQQIQKLIKEQSLRKSLGENACSRVAQSYSSENQCLQLLRLYSELIAD